MIWSCCSSYKGIQRFELQDCTWTRRICWTHEKWKLNESSSKKLVEQILQSLISTKRDKNDAKGKKERRNGIEANEEDAITYQGKDTTQEHVQFRRTRKNQSRKWV